MLVLGLQRRGRHVFFVRHGLLLRRRLGVGSASASVEARSRRVGVGNDGLLVDMGNRNAAEIIDGSIVGEHAIVPVSALVADAAVAIAIIDATVETDLLSPIAVIPTVIAVLPPT